MKRACAVRDLPTKKKRLWASRRTIGSLEDAWRERPDRERLKELALRFIEGGALDAEMAAFCATSIGSDEEQEALDALDEKLGGLVGERVFVWDWKHVWDALVARRPKSL